VNDDEEIVHINDRFSQACHCDSKELVGRKLDLLLNPTRLEQFRLAMSEAQLGSTRTVAFSSDRDPTSLINLKTTRIQRDGRNLYLFFGDQLASLRTTAEWEKQERIKELACLYSVSDWIEVSASIRDFFQHLPEYLAPGMHYPEDVRVHSIYQGTTYGDPIDIDKCIRTKLIVRSEERGEIRVGYINDRHDFLVEEQKMLNEIGRILNLALERKELSENEKLIRELKCFYEVAEWIEVSASIQEFFTHLPKYLKPGLEYPEDAQVYSIYQGQEYGELIDSDKCIKTRLLVRGLERGEIRVAYRETRHEFMEEEQKMLNEIGRILNLALERKELSETLSQREEERERLEGRVGQLEKEIAVRAQELDRQQKNLEAVNTYFDRMSHSWEEAQKRMMSIFRAVPDRIAFIDKNRNVIMTNQEGDTIGDKCFRTFFKQDSPCRDCRLAKVIRTKAPVRTEIRDEDEYYEVQALPVFDDKGEVGWITEFYRNITKEKNYEQQLQQADKLASIGQLVSGIGHEINNPNQFIRGNIKIIQQALEDMLPIVDEYYKDHPDLKIARLKYDFFRQHIMVLVNDMAHGSKRIKNIIEGLKSFARKDEGELIDEVEVNTIIDAATRLVHNEVHKHADIQLDLAPDLPVFTGNVQKIEQVLINLVINAAQAIPKDRRGKILVTTRLDDSNIIISVRDNGKGMSERTIKQIFDPFFTTRRAKGGTGLGLPIVHRIVEEHNGMISVNSKVDVGTTFTLTIPTRQKSGPATGDDQKEASPAGDKVESDDGEI
jgi:signal transduction histidine kinase